MNTVEKFFVILASLLILATVFGTPAVLLIAAKMESETYNRLTGARTTTWDAIWVDLKVTTPVKQ